MKVECKVVSAFHVPILPYTYYYLLPVDSVSGISLFAPTEIQSGECCTAQAAGTLYLVDER